MYNIEWGCGIAVPMVSYSFTRFHTVSCLFIYFRPSLKGAITGESFFLLI